MFLPSCNFVLIFKGRIKVEKKLLYYETKHKSGNTDRMDRLHTGCRKHHKKMGSITRII